MKIIDSSSEPDAGGLASDQKEEHGQLARAGDVLPSILHLLPLSNRPFFPGQALPLLVEQEPWLSTFEGAMESGNHTIGLVLIRGSNAEEARSEEFFGMGVACRIHKLEGLEHHLKVLLEGVQRFRIESWVSTERPFVARVTYFPEQALGQDRDIKPYTIAIINTIKELVSLNSLYGEELKFFLKRLAPDQPAQLADFSASLTTASKQELQDVVETLDLQKRLELVLLLLKKEVEVAKVQSRIQKEVEEKISERQHEFFLREQLKAIQNELGISKDDKSADIDRFKSRLERLQLSDEAQRRINDEMDKLSLLETGSPEYAVTRNYLDWLTQLPWGVCSQDNLDLDNARTILDRDHDGLVDVKNRIVEFLAVGALKGEISGSILLFVGPPGVGKTSLGRSIASALDRKFYRFSVGGIRDEAEIKGHRRTYIGAMPGKFIQAIKEVKVSNPVIMLDEIDKIGASYQGDPASALLEVLDPEQNIEFLDHYLDVRFDLSKVLFIATANQLDTIPAPLLDRVEVIRLSGYISSEKLEIASHHLVPKQRAKAGVKANQLKISKAALTRVIEGYARESGVRGLEKHLGTIVRKAVIKLLDGVPAPIKIGPKDLENYLGKPLFSQEKLFTNVGVVTGLAWTPLGGATLSIEATRVNTMGRGLKLTGQLGDVMRESASIAYSHIFSNCAAYHAPAHYFDKAYIHLHVPSGATPKDGPSAGITMATALLSLATNKRFRRSLAMSGELSLTGHVLAVGGIREKVIAARRARINELILPDGNRRDFEELPQHIREGISVHFVSQFRQVVGLVFPDIH